MNTNQKLQVELRKERQHRLVQLQFVAVRREKLDFPKQKLFGDFQLVFVTQTVENQFLVDPGEYLRTQCLLRPGQDVTLQSRIVGVLKAHQFSRADIRREPNEEAAEIECLACCHSDAGCVE